MSDKNKTEYSIPKSSLADIILVIAKHLNLILVLTIITTVFTIIYANKTYVPRYTSFTKMFVPGEGGGRTQLSKIAGQFGLVTRGTSGFDLSSSSLYPDLVSSYTFAKIMYEKEFFTKKYGKTLPLIAIFTYGDKPVPDNIDTLRIASLNRISNLVKFKMAMGFFVMQVTTQEPQFSRDLADTIITELDKLQRKYKKQTVNEKIEYLEKKIAITKIELENKEDQLKNFREKNRNVDNSPTLLLTQERLRRNVDVHIGIFLTLKQQLELEKIEEVQKSSFVQILDYPSLPLSISNPLKKSIYIIGGLMGFFIALGLSFVIEYFTIINPGEKQKLQTAKKHAIESLKRIFTLKWLINKNN